MLHVQLNVSFKVFFCFTRLKKYQSDTIKLHLKEPKFFNYISVCSPHNKWTSQKYVLYSLKFRCLRQNLSYINKLAEAQRITGIDKSNIGNVCKGRLIRAGGYHWEYVSANNT